MRKSFLYYQQSNNNEQDNIDIIRGYLFSVHTLAFLCYMPRSLRNAFGCEYFHLRLLQYYDNMKMLGRISQEINLIYMWVHIKCDGKKNSVVQLSSQKLWKSHYAKNLQTRSWRVFWSLNCFNWTENFHQFQCKYLLHVKN